MYHELVFSSAFPGPKKSSDGICVCVTFPWPKWFSMAFGPGPLEGVFAEISLCNFSHVESAGFKSFFSALAVSLATLRIFDENSHKSGRQTCSFFWALPESEAFTP